MQNRIQGILNRVEKYPAIKSLLFYFYDLSGFRTLRNKINSKPLRTYGSESLLKAKIALDSIDVLFWIDFGTLLGAVRDNNFIKGDLDVDISMFLKDYSPKIATAMEEAGFKLISEIKIDHGQYGLEQTYDYKGLNLDIFFYTIAQDKMYMHAFMPYPPAVTMTESMLNKGGVLPIEQYLPYTGFKKTSLFGLEFTIPKDEHKHLSYHYGDDYLIPRKWNYRNLVSDNVNASFLQNKPGILKVL